MLRRFLFPATTWGHVEDLGPTTRFPLKFKAVKDIQGVRGKPYTRVATETQVSHEVDVDNERTMLFIDLSLTPTIFPPHPSLGRLIVCLGQLPRQSTTRGLAMLSGKMGLHVLNKGAGEAASVKSTAGSSLS